MHSVANNRRQSTVSQRFRQPLPGSAAVAATINRLLDVEPNEAEDRIALSAVAAGPQQLDAAMRLLATWRQIGGVK